MKNFEFEHEGNKLWYSRSLAVSCLVYCVKDNEIYVLANKRGQGCEFNKGLWNVPGGFLDFDETAEQAASRECFEETGVKFEPNEWGFVELDTKTTNSKRQTIIARYRIITNNFDRVFTNANSEPDEVEEIRWINIKDINKFKFANRQVEPILKYKPLIFTRI